MLPTTISAPCERCLPFRRYEFANENDFYTFEESLDTETFIRVVSTDEMDENFPEVTHQCTFCNEDWVLSFPERSWRGYFLPATEAPKRRTPFVFESNSTKKSPNCGCCLGMIFLVIALIIYVIYSFFDFLIDLIF
ncbi:hypothetical protein [Kordia jejudonensis]|uniref:hypothetical protein n=1 Tax=Kordia jejudonensis TaxID=1348245 RepID=UPI000629A51F|nr:hypothetical protein [Kordia jejudonensis]